MSRPASSYRGARRNVRWHRKAATRPARPAVKTPPAAYRNTKAKIDWPAWQTGGDAVMRAKSNHPHRAVRRMYRP